MLHIINASVADLWKHKEINEETRESQLLYGEMIQVLEDYGDWIRIKALEQSKCLELGVWTAYPGWIQRKFIAAIEKIPQYNLVVKSKNAYIPFEVSMGTYLEGIEERRDVWVIRHVDGKVGAVDKKDVWEIHRKVEDFHQSIIDCGREFIGNPYVWGGRCSKDLDCSGFVNLLYRIHGKEIPRDSHDQFLKGTPCKSDELVPGDLVFMASEKKPHRMNHVMIYTGEGRLLEATAASGNVREIHAEVRFKVPLHDNLPHVYFRKLL